MWPQEKNLNSSVFLWIICIVFKILPEWQSRSLFKAILTFPPMFFCIYCFEIHPLFYQLVTQWCELAGYWEHKNKLHRKEPELPEGHFRVDRARLFSELHSEKIRCLKRENPIRLWKVVLLCGFVLFHQGRSNAGTGCKEVL